MAKRNKKSGKLKEGPQSNRSKNYPLRTSGRNDNTDDTGYYGRGRNPYSQRQNSQRP